MSAVMTFEQSVKERLKSIVADLIPEERWNEIVESTVKDFEKNDLPKLVRAELTDKYKTAINAEFQKPEWNSVWGISGPEVSAALRQMIVEAAPLVLASMIGGAMQSVQQQMQNALQQIRPVHY